MRLGAGTGRRFWRTRRDRITSAVIALLLALALGFFVLGRGPGTLIWLTGARLSWLPFVGAGLTWLPVPLDWLPLGAKGEPGPALANRHRAPAFGGGGRRGTSPPPSRRTPTEAHGTAAATGCFHSDAASRAPARARGRRRRRPRGAILAGSPTPTSTPSYDNPTSTPTAHADADAYADRIPRHVPTPTPAPTPTPTPLRAGPSLQRQLPVRSAAPNRLPAGPTSRPDCSGSAATRSPSTAAT